MREFEREPRLQPPGERRVPGNEPAAPAALTGSSPALAGPSPALDAALTGSSPALAGPSPALDAASIMHLQRTAGNQGVVQMLAGDEDERSPVHDVVGKGGGAPLDSSTRATMESAFGTSFEDVRVHTGGTASRSAESVGANAYTVGNDIVFKDGQYSPGSSAGQKTIAHELSHVVQQSRGPVDGNEAPGGIKVSDPSDRYERAADQTASQVVSSVQRESVPEEEEEMAQS